MACIGTTPSTYLAVDHRTSLSKELYHNGILCEGKNAVLATLSTTSRVNKLPLSAMVLYAQEMYPADVS